MLNRYPLTTYAMMFSTMLIVVVIISISTRPSTIQQRYTLNSNGSVTYTEFDTRDSVELASANISQSLLVQFDHTYSATNYKQVSRDLVSTAKLSALIKKLSPYAMGVSVIGFLIYVAFRLAPFLFSEDRDSNDIKEIVFVPVLLFGILSGGMGLITKFFVDENLLEIGKILIS